MLSHYIKKLKSAKDNYRPVSILSNISKVYERCLYNQIQSHFEKILSLYQCGFHKGFNSFDTAELNLGPTGPMT